MSLGLVVGLGAGRAEQEESSLPYALIWTHMKIYIGPMYCFTYSYI